MYININETVMRFVDIKNDIAFRKIFGSLIGLYNNGIDLKIIALSFEFSIEQVEQILNLHD